MAVDVIRSGVRWSQLESPDAGASCLQVGPAQGGFGDARPAAPSSRCGLRSAGARIGFTHIVQVVPYSCSLARRGRRRWRWRLRAGLSARWIAPARGEPQADARPAPAVPGPIRFACDGRFAGTSVWLGGCARVSAVPSICPARWSSGLALAHDGALRQILEMRHLSHFDTVFDFESMTSQFDFPPPVMSSPRLARLTRRAAVALRLQQVARVL